MMVQHAGSLPPMQESQIAFLAPALTRCRTAVEGLWGEQIRGWTNLSASISACIFSYPVSSFQANTHKHSGHYKVK